MPWQDLTSLSRYRAVVTTPLRHSATPAHRDTMLRRGLTKQNRNLALPGSALTELHSTLPLRDNSSLCPCATIPYRCSTKRYRSATPLSFAGARQHIAQASHLPALPLQSIALPCHRNSTPRLTGTKLSHAGTAPYNAITPLSDTVPNRTVAWRCSTGA